MKNLILILFIFIAFSSIVHAQDMEADSVKYERYVNSFQEGTPLDYDAWHIKFGYVTPTITNPPEGYYSKYAEDYNVYLGKQQYKMAKKPQSVKTIMCYEDWCKSYNVTAYHPLKTGKTNVSGSNQTSGDYLILASNQILSGIGLQTAGGIMCIVGGLNPTITSENEVSVNRLVYVGYGFILGGFISEMVGFNNIGKAGISLNQNGVGIKINF
jgi:hypothetical protein